MHTGMVKHPHYANRCRKPYRRTLGVLKKAHLRDCCHDAPSLCPPPDLSPQISMCHAYMSRMQPSNNCGVKCLGRHATCVQQLLAACAQNVACLQVPSRAREGIIPPVHATCNLFRKQYLAQTCSMRLIRTKQARARCRISKKNNDVQSRQQ